MLRSVKEMYPLEFRELLEHHFRYVQIYWQGVLAGSIITSDPKELPEDGGVTLESTRFSLPDPEFNREATRSGIQSRSYYEVCLIATETDPEVEPLSRQAKVIRVAETSTPLKVYNAAIRQAESEYVLLLDPDLEALSEGWLVALLQHAQRTEVGAVGGKLVSEEGHTLQAGLILNPEEREGLPQIFYRLSTGSTRASECLWIWQETAARFPGRA